MYFVYFIDLILSKYTQLCDQEEGWDWTCCEGKSLSFGTGCMSDMYRVMHYPFSAEPGFLIVSRVEVIQLIHVQASFLKSYQFLMFCYFCSGFGILWYFNCLCWENYIRIKSIMGNICSHSISCIFSALPWCLALTDGMLLVIQN